MRNSFSPLKQVLVCCAVVFFLPNVKAQRMEAAPKVLAEYELVNDVELFSNGMTNVKRIYRKKATTPPTRKAEMPRGKDTDIEPPLVIIVDENGCETGCTEHGWGSMGCMFKNPENIPVSFRLGSDGHFYEEGKKAPITAAAFSKFTRANKSMTDTRRALRRKQNAGSPTEPSSMWVTICNPPGLNCHDVEILDLLKTKPKTGASLQNFSDGTVSFRFVDSKAAFCLRPDGTVSHCDWLPASDEIAKMHVASPPEKDESNDWMLGLKQHKCWDCTVFDPETALPTIKGGGKLEEVKNLAAPKSFFIQIRNEYSPLPDGVTHYELTGTVGSRDPKLTVKPGGVLILKTKNGEAFAAEKIDKDLGFHFQIDSKTPFKDFLGGIVFANPSGPAYIFNYEKLPMMCSSLSYLPEEDVCMIELSRTAPTDNGPKKRRAAPDRLPNFTGTKNTGRSNTSGCCLRLTVAPSSTGGSEARRAAPVPTEKAVFGGVKPGSEVKVTVVDEQGAVVDAALWSVRNTESAMSVDLSKLPAASYTIQVRAGAQVEIYDFSEVGLPPQLVSRWTVSDNQPAQHHWCGDKRAFVEFCEDCAGECDVYLSTASERGNVVDLPKTGKPATPKIDKEALSAIVKKLNPKETSFFLAVDKNGRPTKITKLAECPVGAFLLQFERN